MSKSIKRNKGVLNSSSVIRSLTASLGVLLAAWMMQGAAAYAQAPVPPVFETLDENGVDVSTGRFVFTAEPLVIGQAGAGGLTYLRTFSLGSWRDDYTGTIRASSSTYTVSFRNRSETFTESGGSFTSDQGMGSTLTYNSGTGRFTYTTRGGVVAFFDQSVALGGVEWGATAMVTQVSTPDGETLNFHYNTVTAGGASAIRLQSVTNNLGYQLHFEFALNNPTMSSQLPEWRRLTKVTGINNAVAYCSPTANTCGLTGWPTLSFSQSGLYEFITDALGRETRLTHQASLNGEITDIRWPSSSTTDSVEITYSFGRVNAIHGLGAGLRSYTYSENSGQRTTTYSILSGFPSMRVVVSDMTSNRVLTDTDGESRTMSFQYDGDNRLTRVTYPEGNYTQHTRDARGNITETRHVAKSGSGLSDVVTSAAFPSTCTNVVTCNLPTSETDARGFRTDYTYNSTHGGVLTATQPAPSGSTPVGSGTRPQVRYAYSSLYAYYKNSGGSIVQAPSPVYRLTEVSSCATTASCDAGADEVVTTIGYGANGVANNRLPVSRSSGSGNGALTATVAAAYDNVGNLQTEDGPLAGTTDTIRYRYDAARQLIGAIGPDPDGAGALRHRAVRYTYNVDGQVTDEEQGFVVSQSDAHWAAFQTLQKQTTTYDEDQRPIARRLVNGSTTVALAQVSYDNASRVQCMAVRMNPAVFGSPPSSACSLGTTGSNGPDRITRNTYNNASQVTQVTTGYASGAPINVATTTFTSSGLPATQTDARGYRTTFEYDGFDRLRKIRFPNPSAAGSSSTTDYEQYTYDAASNVTQTRRRDGATISFTFDNLSRATLMDAPSGNNDVSYTYDLLGRTLSAAYTGDTQSFAYDALSRLTSQTGPLGAVSYQYDLAGRRTRLTYPDSFYVDYDVDLTGGVTAIRENGASSGAGVLASFAYDNLGRRVSLTRGNGVTTRYAFDAGSRLSALVHDLASTANDQTYGYAYSAGSQITRRTATNDSYAWPTQSASSQSYTRNGLDQYTAVAGASFSYDGRGNLTSNGATSYGYDVHNRLTSAGGATLAYDPVGRLRETSLSGTTTRFAYDGVDLVAEYNTSGTMLRRFVFGPGVDEPLVWYEGAGTSDRRWLIADERGSVVAITDGAGAATALNTYDAYGTPGGANQGRFQYTGQAWLPEAALYHYKARAYAPAIGRFLQTDPILYEGGINLYAYVGNDPVNLVDPFGLAAGKVCIPNLTCPKDRTGDTIVVTGKPEPQPPIRTPPTQFSNGTGGNVGPQGDQTEPRLYRESEQKCYAPEIQTQLRALSAASNLVVDAGQYIMVGGGAVALASLPYGGAPAGLGILALGTKVALAGGTVGLASGIGLALLGDQRAGVRAALEVGAGRLMRNLPDELTGLADAGVSEFIEDFVRDLPTCE